MMIIVSKFIIHIWYKMMKMIQKHIKLYELGVVGVQV